MMKLYIGNKAYSSWSMRGWLACKQAGLPFEEVVAPLYDADWAERRQAPAFAPSDGRVPILWDGDIAVWDSLAIIQHLDEATGHSRFWPADPAARAMARSVAAEMHSSFAALRSKHPMNTRRRFPANAPDADVAADLARIMSIWSAARDRFGAQAGGDFLFGAFGAADIMFAPVVTRIETYGLPATPLARDYMAAVVAQPFVAQWLSEANEEPWVIEKYEAPTAG